MNELPETLRSREMRALSARAGRFGRTHPADRRGGAGAGLVRAPAGRLRPLSRSPAAARPRCRPPPGAAGDLAGSRPRAQRDHPAEVWLFRRRTDLRRSAERQSDAGHRPPQRTAGGARDPLHRRRPRPGLGGGRARLSGAFSDSARRRAGAADPRPVSRRPDLRRGRIARVAEGGRRRRRASCRRNITRRLRTATCCCACRTTSNRG